MSIHAPIKLLKHLFPRSFTLLLSEIHISHVSTPYNVVCTITFPYNHFCAFMLNPILFITHYTATNIQTNVYRQMCTDKKKMNRNRDFNLLIRCEHYYYYSKRSAVQGWERLIYTLSVRRPQRRNTNIWTERKEGKIAETKVGIE